MKKMMLVALTVVMAFGLEVGQKPKEVTIGGDNGGYVKDNSPWNSSMIKDKVYVMFYVDPDEKDKNEHFAQELKKKHYDRNRYGSIAMINLAATWKPNFVIEKILASKQKEFKDTIYVKDKASVLVKEWGVADDESDIIIFDKNGIVIFYKAGKMTPEDMQQAYKAIEDNL